MATPDWTRPVLKRRIRVAPPIVTAILCAAAFAVGMTVDREPSRIVVPVIAPVSVAVPPAPPPQVVVAPVPPAAAAPVPQPPAPRATRPQVAAHCLVLSEGQPPDPMCAWDDGFPAISGDGSLIATKYHPVYGQTGNVGESVRFLDTTTGRVVRESIILSPDEYVPGDALDKLRPEVLARAAAVQRELDTGEFRTLIALGDHNLGDDESHVDATRIHAEFRDAGTRLHVAWLTIHDAVDAAAIHVDAEIARVDPRRGVFAHRERGSTHGKRVTESASHDPDRIDCTGNCRVRRIARGVAHVTRPGGGTAASSHADVSAAAQVVHRLHRHADLRAAMPRVPGPGGAVVRAGAGDAGARPRRRVVRRCDLRPGHVVLQPELRHLHAQGRQLRAAVV
jgi:hypothetical protein